MCYTNKELGMILFKEDWAKYPSAIRHYSTTNKSFLELASKYRLMGVENYDFLLALYNPILEHLDPYSKNLTTDQKTMIRVECIVNPWYFFREVCRIKPMAGTTPNKYRANRGNIALTWCWFNRVITYNIQPRQTGKSVGSDSIDEYILVLGADNTEIDLFTKNDDLRRRNIKRLKGMMDLLPGYIDRRTAKDVDNGEEISVIAKKNVYKTIVPQASKKAADMVGRGNTGTIIKIDEGPYIPNAHISIPVLLASTIASFAEAKSKNEHYGISFSTTSGERDTPEGSFIYNKVMNASEWTEKFFDCKNRDELEALVMSNTRDKSYSINLTFNHRQLGYSDEWMAEQLRVTGLSGKAADKDLFNVWTIGNDEHPIRDASLLKRLEVSKKEPKYVDINKFVTRWYVSESERDHIFASTKILIGADTSDATGNDDIFLTFLRLDTLEVIGTGLYNEVNLFSFSEWLAKLMVAYENTILIPERKSSAPGLIDYIINYLLMNGIDPFTRIFNRVVNEFDENPERFKEINKPMNKRDSHVYIQYRKEFGFATSGAGYASRKNLYSTVLINAVKRSCDVVYDSNIINQIKTLTIIDGRVDHPKGEHDDAVISWLLTHWLIQFGKNLSFYGIDVRCIKKEIEKKFEQAGIEEKYEIYEQEMIRKKIATLYQQLLEEDDFYICSRIEHELNYLNKKLKLREEEIFSLDDLLRQVRESKQKNRNRYNK